jgi:hypothetical protein
VLSPNVPYVTKDASDDNDNNDKDNDNGNDNVVRSLSL